MSSGGPFLTSYQASGLAQTAKEEGCHGGQGADLHDRNDRLPKGYPCFSLTQAEKEDPQTDEQLGASLQTAK